MDPVAMADMQVQQESTSRSRICTVIAVMACIVMGCFLLLGFSLKRNDELVAILDQYREYLNQQSVQSPPVAAAVPQAAKEAVHVKRAVHRANNTRPDEVQVVYLNAPSSTSGVPRHRGKPADTTPSDHYASPVLVNLSNAARMQQQQLLSNDSSFLLLTDNASSVTQLAAVEKAVEPMSENGSASEALVNRIDGFESDNTSQPDGNETMLGDAVHLVSVAAPLAASSLSGSSSTKKSLLAKTLQTALAGGSQSTIGHDEADRDLSSSDGDEELDPALITDGTRKASNVSLVSLTGAVLSNVSAAAVTVNATGS
uniref:Uncharacterized protein n=1 Tax=Rhipicephalus appendiculatus TaxID=34631 RepID=A0A131Z4U5_RHIAP